MTFVSFDSINVIHLTHSSFHIVRRNSIPILSLATWYSPSAMLFCLWGKLNHTFEANEVTLFNVTSAQRIRIIVSINGIKIKIFWAS